ncbi:glycoside hydrolase superfamily [Bisporella sp. PMI_857]|nr:glycoside hydrolase superfamily [Bisporella sp. PMI_857]
MIINEALRIITWHLLGFSCWRGAVAQTDPTWPIQDNGLQSKIRWDHYSLIIDGHRPFIFSGEMHPFQVPVPELWADILEKMKAAGMRAISVYFHWGFHSQYPDVADFESGAHNLDRFFEMARDIGIFVIVRPGPYINAETSAGGLALWATNGQYGLLRGGNGPEGGTALMLQIENEFPSQWKNVSTKIPNLGPIAYMKSLEARALENGVTIPTMHNMPNTNGKSWSKDYDTVEAGGNPSCWSCIPSDCSTSNPSFTLLNYYDHFQAVSPNQPPMSPEFQGGALNPWYGPAGGCQNKTDAKFVNFYYRDNIAQRMTILNLYMMHGGTNWGWLAAPFLGSSYDYSAAISQDRNIGRNNSSYTNNAALFTTALLNPETKARFYILRHNDPTSNIFEEFKLHVETSVGNFTVPRYDSTGVIDGYESKILVADFHAGPKTTMIYSTAEILSYVLVDDWTVLTLWVPTGLSGEFFLKEAKQGLVGTCDGCSNINFRRQNEGIIVKFVQDTGRTVLTFDNKVRVIIMDREVSYKTFVPGIDSDPLVPTNRTAMIIGPRLVRSARLDNNSGTISLTGDSEGGRMSLEVFTSAQINKIVWNSKALLTKITPWGSIQAIIPEVSGFKAPTLNSWKVRDSLPEIDSKYFDTGLAWVDANHTSTKTGKSGTIPYLFADDYGFCHDHDPMSLMGRSIGASIREY